jgi:hypothetical protein
LYSKRDGVLRGIELDQFPQILRVPRLLLQQCVRDKPRRYPALYHPQVVLLLR